MQQRLQVGALEASEGRQRLKGFSGWALCRAVEGVRRDHGTHVALVRFGERVDLAVKELCSCTAGRAEGGQARLLGWSAGLSSALITAEHVERLHGDEAGGRLSVLWITQDRDRDMVALLQHDAEPVELKVAKLQAAAHILHRGDQVA